MSIWTRIFGTKKNAPPTDQLERVRIRSYDDWARQACDAEMTSAVEVRDFHQFLAALTKELSQRHPGHDMKRISDHLIESVALVCVGCTAVFTKSAKNHLASVPLFAGAQSISFGGPQVAALHAGKCPVCG